MKSPAVVFTSANFAYIDRVATLNKTLKRQHPDWHFVLVAAEPIQARQGLLGDVCDEIVFVQELITEDFNEFAFRYDVVEMCTAVKGAAVSFLLNKYDLPVIYLDPDIAVFGSLKPVLDALIGHSLALTPHILRPEEGQVAIMDNEVNSLKYGIYNLGFLAVSASKTGKRAAQWWDARLRDYAYEDHNAGLFTDQKWMNHAPVFFPDMVTLHHPGMNVASWNINQRLVEMVDGEYYVNGEPLIFMHFTKATSIGPAMTRKYAKENMAVFELWRWYLQEITAARTSLSELAHEDWVWDHFEDGQPIPYAARKLYGKRLDLRNAFPNPFASGSNSYQAWLAGQPGIV